MVAAIRRNLPLAFALAGAVLLFAGHGRCQDKPRDFTRWEKAIAAFEEQDQKTPPPTNGVVFVGSSSIRGWNLAQSFPDHKDALNRGFGGSQLADSVHFAPRIVTKYQPRLVVLYAGDNDLAAGKSPEQVFADFQAFVQVVHKEVPKARIAFVAIKPSLARWKNFDKIQKTNGLIEAYIKKDHRLSYVDVVKPMLGEDGMPRPELFVKDGLHLSAKGYEIWAGLVKPHLK